MEAYCFVCHIGLILIWDNGKNGRLLFCLLYWGYFGIMENEMEAYCFVCYIGVILIWKIKWKTTVLSVILGLFWDNGK